MEPYEFNITAKAAECDYFGTRLALLIPLTEW